MTLKRMSCGLSMLKAGPVPEGAQVVFRSLYNISRMGEDRRKDGALVEQCDMILEEVDAALAMLGYLSWECNPGRGITQFGPGSFKDTTVASLRAFQIDTNVIREEEATQAGANAPPPLLREDGHLDPATLASLRVRVTQCEECLREVQPVGTLALAHQSRSRLLWKQAENVYNELLGIQDKQRIVPVDGTYNTATLKYIGITQLAPDDKVAHSRSILGILSIYGNN